MEEAVATVTKGAGLSEWSNELPPILLTFPPHLLSLCPSPLSFPPQPICPPLQPSSEPVHNPTVSYPSLPPSQFLPICPNQQYTVVQNFFSISCQIRLISSLFRVVELMHQIVGSPALLEIILLGFRFNSLSSNSTLVSIIILRRLLLILINDLCGKCIHLISYYPLNYLLCELFLPV